MSISCNFRRLRKIRSTNLLRWQVSFYSLCCAMMMRWCEMMMIKARHPPARWREPRFSVLLAHTADAHTPLVPKMEEITTYKGPHWRLCGLLCSFGWVLALALVNQPRELHHPSSRMFPLVHPTYHHPFSPPTPRSESGCIRPHPPLGHTAPLPTFIVSSHFSLFVKPLSYNPLSLAHRRAESEWEQFSIDSITSVKRSWIHRL